MKHKGAFTNGVHAYYGRYNSRGQRLRSKILHGIKPPSKAAWAAVENLNKKAHL